MPSTVNSSQRLKGNIISIQIFQPENILFDSKKADSNLKVIDFGASGKMSANENLTKRVGTVELLFKFISKPFYIAPEILNVE